MTTIPGARAIPEALVGKGGRVSLPRPKPFNCGICGEPAELGEIVILVDRDWTTSYVHRYGVSERCHRLATYGQAACEQMGWA